ncbi:MAG: transaldolase [Puniceicoccales bacterium]|jgi:transaldolase|nr:transaldolase [Puniceicoccales bacterium]
MESSLEQLKKHSTVVADSGDLEMIKKFCPRDATTNPSLILKAAQQEQYKFIIDKALRQYENRPMRERMNAIVAGFGLEILKIIGGRVSSEIDARLSFDAAAMVDSARNIISMYEHGGVDRERVLVKIAATWEGVLAAKVLEQEGIHCNLTLIFSLEQALICGQANVTLISPFVGRILDWHTKNNPSANLFSNDPGVNSVKTIHGCYKARGYKTEIMGASFRNVGEIVSLAGCDLLTIGPKFLEELQLATFKVERQIENDATLPEKIPDSLSEKEFRFSLNENQMATEKLSEGIRLFVKDTTSLEDLLSQRSV